MYIVFKVIGQTEKKILRANHCSKSGWNKDASDIHRIIPSSQGGLYVEGNVVVLCPNCHRLAKNKKLVFNVSNDIKKLSKMNPSTH